MEYLALVRNTNEFGSLVEIATSLDEPSIEILKSAVIGIAGQIATSLDQSSLEISASRRRA